MGGGVYSTPFRIANNSKYSEIQAVPTQVRKDKVARTTMQKR